MAMQSQSQTYSRLDEDFGWTERQREVLALLAKGYTNGQIGERLGISLDGAKWHVSEIISKLGVDTREEAAEYWRRYNGAPARLRRIWTSALMGPVLLRMGAGLGLVALVGVAVFLVMTFTGGGGTNSEAAPTQGAGGAASATPSSSPTGTASPSSTASATPAQGSQPGEPDRNAVSFGGVESRLIDVNSTAQPPANASLYLVTGCWGCEGGDAGIIRVNGETSTDVSPPKKASEEFTSIKGSPDGSHFAAAICDSAPGCGSGIGNVARNHSRVVDSFDGGITWTQRSSYDGWAHVVEVTDKAIVVSVIVFGEPGSYTTTYTVIQGGKSTSVTPPSDASISTPPLVLSDGTLLWRTRANNSLVDDTGQPAFAPPLTPQDQITWVDRLSNGTWIAAWVRVTESGPGGGFVGVFEKDSTPLHVYRLPSTLPAYDVAATLDTTHVLTNAEFTGTPGRLPALIDLKAGTSTTLKSAAIGAGSNTYGGRNTFVAYAQGPFLTVHGTGDCLNVREAPAKDAKVVGCFADGVLLGDRGDSRQAGGLTWAAVTTPGGQEGWASTEFLQK